MENSCLEIKAENIRRRNRLESDILKHFFEGICFFFPVFGAVYACVKTSKLRTRIYELKSDLRTLIHDIGGYEHLFQLRELRGFYGSYAHIKELLDHRFTLERKLDDYKKLNITHYDLESIKLLRAQGNLEVISSKISELEKVNKELHGLRVKHGDLIQENNKLLSDLNILKREFKNLESTLQVVLVDIGGQDSIPQIKKLKDDYGSFKSIREKLEKPSNVKIPSSVTASLSPEDAKLMEKLKTELSNVKVQGGTGSVKYNEKLSKEVEDYKKEIASIKKELQKSSEELNKLYVDIGGREFVPQIKKLKDDYGSFKSIREKLEKPSNVKIPSSVTASLSVEDAKLLEKLKKELSQIKATGGSSEKYNEKLSKEVEDYKKEIASIKKELQKSNEELNKLYVDVGGKEFVPKIRKLKNNYGSFEHIDELLENQKPTNKDEDTKFAQQLRKYGSATFIIEKISESDKNKKELSSLKTERDNLTQDNKKLLDEISKLKKELEDKDIKLQKVFIDIDGKNLMKK